MKFVLVLLITAVALIGVLMLSIATFFMIVCVDYGDGVGECLADVPSLFYY